jgi:hypothetical protein
MIDIICRCGHFGHFDDFYPLELIAGTCAVTICPCKKYVPDNLSYIEKLAKEKGLV